MFPPLTAEVSRLKALAVFAFCAEMTRLPGHRAPRLIPVNATAHTTPSRFTMLPHMFMFRPDPSVLVAVVSAAFRAAWLGRVV